MAYPVTGCQDGEKIVVGVMRWREALPPGCADGGIIEKGKRQEEEKEEEK